MRQQNSPTTPTLSLSQRVRVITAGMLVPPFMAVIAWWSILSWGDLPNQISSHGSTEGADSLLPPEAIINAWPFGCLLAALIVCVVHADLETFKKDLVQTRAPDSVTYTQNIRNDTLLVARKP